MIDNANRDTNLSFVYQFAKIYLIIYVKELRKLQSKFTEQ